METAGQRGATLHLTEGRWPAERRFFSLYAIALALVTLAGFAPSFYLRGTIEPFAPGPLRPLRPEVVVHGALATGLLLLFPLQALLVAAGRTALHIRLGQFGFVLLAMVTLSAYVVAIGPYHEPLPPGAPPGATQAMLIILPLNDFFTLVVLGMLAWRWRRKPQNHKRIMIVIGCLLASAALFRFPFGDRTSLAGIVLVMAALYAAVLPLWLWDLMRLRKLHRATAIASAILFIDMFLRLPLAPTPLWADFVGALPGYGPPGPVATTDS